MDYKSPIPDEDTLRQMSYSELRKMASKHGIVKKRRSLKADKIISKLLSSASSDEIDSFSTPLANEVNSSRKNKENKFNLDVITPLETPRRGTYSVETPIACVLLEETELKSPIVPKTPLVLDISNVSVVRGSERKLRPRKVSFVSPKKMTPRTPTKYISLKDRPKTPVASKTGKRRTSLTTPVVQPDSMKKIMNDFSCVPKSALKEETAPKIKKGATPSCAPKSTPKEDASRMKRAPTPSCAPKSASKENTASRMKRTATPNFRRIHQKAFEKMESIDDYQQRKLKESAKKIAVAVKAKNKITKPKTKIPVLFSGIPFIPSTTSTKGLKFNFSSGMPKSFTGEKMHMKGQTSVIPEGKQKTEIENIVLVGGKKPKFDLQASLSRKLGYKPYSGPLKPLSDSNCMNSPIPVCHHGAIKEPVNPVVHALRNKSRKVIRGVRTNKRFELQMRNRKLE